MASPGLADTSASIGARLYLGGAPLNGRIAGQRTALPAAVLVCANCHAGGANEAAPDLRRGWLRLVLSRRNGPAARYTRDGFCRTLRTGVDPVYIVLPVQMPRFSISDTDCDALWTYLNEKK